MLSNDKKNDFNFVFLTCISNVNRSATFKFDQDQLETGIISFIENQFKLFSSFSRSYIKTENSVSVAFNELDDQFLKFDDFAKLIAVILEIDFNSCAKDKITEQIKKNFEMIPTHQLLTAVCAFDAKALPQVSVIIQADSQTTYNNQTSALFFHKISSNDKQIKLVANNNASFNANFCYLLLEPCLAECKFVIGNLNPEYTH